MANQANAGRGRQEIMVLMGRSVASCPKGAVAVRSEDEVPLGTYFVRYSPSRETGRWSFEARDRPWGVGVRGPAGTKDSLFFASVDVAVEKATRLNRRLSS